MELATLAGGPARNATATLAGGCFWCTEAVFKRLKGVVSVISGYAGGNPPAGGGNPTYGDVSKGGTNHAEAIQIKFKPEIISFDQILEVFLATHDPTTLNRQGADSGTQYRSAIFYHDEGQKEVAEKSIKAHQVKFKDPIVTEIRAFSNFFEAENYHQDYYEKNFEDNAYCSLVIDPKIQKLMIEFKEKVKEEYQ